MTTPNIEELIASFPEQNTSNFEWNAAQILNEWGINASAALQSQAERIKELEAECEVERLRLTACGVAALGYFDGCKDEYKSASLDDVLRLNKRCTDLRAELGDLPEAQAEMLSEIKQLRAELAAIAATEPVAYRWVWKSKPWDIEGWCYTNTPPTVPELQEIEPLFTHPMPAQDVTELVDALEGLMHKDCGEPAFVKARTALSKYKGAK